MTYNNDRHPRKLDKYSVEGVLGEGGMGLVYKCRDTVSGQLAALKTIRKDGLDPSASEEILARFEREAMVVRKLSHPNIVAIFDFGEDEQIPYIAMELIRGHELKDFLLDGLHFDLVQTIHIVEQILSALAFCHDAGIFHRDLKPSNIILQPDGVVKIADFGIARIESSDLTQVGAVLGTPSYMSPEQVKGQRIDARSDLFSAAVILYELLTDTKPFPGKGFMSIVRNVVNTEPKPPTVCNAKLPAAFDKLIEKALAKDVDERFQSAKEFAKELVRAGKKAGKDELDLGVFKALDGEHTPEPSVEVLDLGSSGAQTVTQEARSKPPAGDEDGDEVRDAANLHPATVSSTKTGLIAAIIGLLVLAVISASLGVWWYLSAGVPEVPSTVAAPPHVVSPSPSPGAAAIP